MSVLFLRAVPDRGDQRHARLPPTGATAARSDRTGSSRSASRSFAGSAAMSSAWRKRSEVMHAERALARVVEAVDRGGREQPAARRRRVAAQQARARVELVERHVRAEVRAGRGELQRLGLHAVGIEQQLAVVAEPRADRVELRAEECRRTGRCGGSPRAGRAGSARTRASGARCSASSSPLRSRTWCSADMKNGQSRRDAGVDALDRGAADGRVLAGEDEARVVVRVVAVNAAHHRDAIHPPRQQRQVFAHREARHRRRDRLVRPANLGGRVRLHVERFELAPPAEEEQADDRLRFRLWSRCRGRGVEAAEQPEAAGNEQIAPADAGAGAFRVSEDAEHASLPGGSGSGGITQAYPRARAKSSATDYFFANVTATCRNNSSGGLSVCSSTSR